MKKVFVMIAVALTFAVSASAQDNAQKQGERPKFNKTEMVQKHTNRMVERYGLNDEQAKQLLQLNTTYGGQMMGMPGGRGPRPGRPGQGGPEGGPQGAPDSAQHQRPSKEQMEAMRKEMDTKRAAYNAELKKILTEEQYAKYEADQKNFRPGRRPGGRSFNGGQNRE